MVSEAHCKDTKIGPGNRIPGELDVAQSGKLASEQVRDFNLAFLPKYYLNSS